MLTDFPSNLNMNKIQVRKTSGAIMKNFLFCTAIVFVSLFAMAAPRDADWQKVDDAIKKGLPKTAIEELEPIIKQAIAEKKYGEATKAIARRIVLEGNIQGNKPEEKITRMEKEIETAPAEIKPLLQTILADWYWQYFQQNRWRFMRRTQTAEAPGKDFTTWDLPRLFAGIDKRFSEALSHEKLLKATPVSEFGDVLEKGTLPDAYRPTLYDFIANEVLQFYMSGEQAGAKPQDAFEVSAESPIFDSVEKFLAWDVQRAAELHSAESPQTNGTSNKSAASAEWNSAALSPIAKAIHLYQKLLKIHQNDKDKSAFIDADIGRLVYGKNIAFGEEKNARFKKAIRAVAEKWSDNELAAVAWYHYASAIRDEGKLTEAHAIAERTAKDFPKSNGAALCRNLIDQIESKSASIVTERIWNAPFPKIEVRYKNIESVYFRAVPMDWDSFVKNRKRLPDYLNDEERKEILRKKPALEWSHKLPLTDDFKERTVELPAPKDLQRGFYFVITSHNADFSEKLNQLSIADVWVSDLAFILRNREKFIEGFVLDANSGEPIRGAEVGGWSHDYQNGKMVELTSWKTDENGFFQFTGEQGKNYIFRARHGMDEVGAQQETYGQYWNRGEPGDQTVLFTDRAIYRPGQTIQYKGIALHVDQTQDNYEVIKDRVVTVVFLDANGKEIAKQERRCNDFGSFAGSFTAPKDRLMGAMTIRTYNPEGAASVRVEEYKRPKFQVKLDAPKTAPKLNERVSLNGSAMAYTGAAIDGANVKYRVVREVQWPWWWGWYGWGRFGGGRGNDSQEIAHGTLKTELDGSFKIEFVAKPDFSIAETNEPTFVFKIYADVTDNAGETRSDQRTIKVGYVALQAMMTADEWQTDSSPVNLKITTQTLDGKPQTAEGVVKVYELKSPEKVRRPSLTPRYRPFVNETGSDSENLETDLSDPNNWPLGKVVAQKNFATDKEGKTNLEFKLKSGAYRAILETKDRFGKSVTGKLPIQVLQPNAAKFGIKIPHLLAQKTNSFEPGEEFLALWGTGYDKGRAFVEIEHRNEIIQRFWTKPGRTQQQIKLAVTEAMRGGFTLHVTQVRENRAYLESRHVEVPWSNKELEIRWEHFTSKMEPNQKETWTAVISSVLPSSTRQKGGKANKDVKRSNRALRSSDASAERISAAHLAVAEMVATLYDESLDAFAPHHWMERLNIFRQDYSTAQAIFQNREENFNAYWSDWNSYHRVPAMTYRHFPYDITQNLWGYQYFERNRGISAQGGSALIGGLSGYRSEDKAAISAPETAIPIIGALSKSKVAQKDEMVGELGLPGQSPSAPKSLDLSQVTARKNLNETAFFFPQLTSDSNGVVRMTFTMPEALTQWKFMGFAHDKNLRSGFLEGKTVTSKDLMVQPNPPRFLREGDEVEFVVKVSNQSDATQKGKVRLTFDNVLPSSTRQKNAETSTDASKKNRTSRSSDDSAESISAARSTDALLGNNSPEQNFEIPAKESRSFSWKIKTPEGLSMLSYKAVAATDKLSDGEEGIFPVLSRRILATESLTLPIRGPAEKEFKFAKLLESGKSDTLKNQNLVVQMVSNPSWYAVMALPYLMEFPYECSEQTFNRFYVNSLARHIAKSDPKIHKIFEQWRGTPALDSPLEKNQDLKSVTLEESPWVRQAENESQAHRNVGILFDDNRLDYETQKNFEKLAQMQNNDGSWPWFPGGPGNDYITLYITTGFGRMRHLGLNVQMEPAIRSLNRLDNWIDEIYREIVRRGTKAENHLSPTIALYLYGRSFFLKDKTFSASQREAVDYFLGQAREHWLKLDNRQSQAHLAIALNRFDDQKTARAIMTSIKERSVTTEEMGMFWRDLELSWWWFRAPIETQALMIEAFDEVMNDAKSVEDCKVWLLKQKQTQDWKTTKATADAVYALLLRGAKNLASDELVEVSLGGKKIEPEKVEAGTGFYEERFSGREIKPAMGEITVKKVDEGVAWGSVNWQYLEDMTKVTPHEGTPLKLKKAIFKKVNTARGPVLESAKDLQVGDELVVRIELRTDRDMEYVHLKDQRGSGTEPVNVLSQYKFQDGLAYYESTRDTASHFFIDYLPKGTYVFEYSTRIQLRGEYQSGIAEIQCMYAPEFNSHSESFELVVK
jgi:uncharacterized protein YfaS (alpha-2-macroglobulin family)